MEGEGRRGSSKSQLIEGGYFCVFIDPRSFANGDSIAFKSLSAFTINLFSILKYGTDLGLTGKASRRRHSPNSRENVFGVTAILAIFLSSKNETPYIHNAFKPFGVDLAGIISLFTSSLYNNYIYIHSLNGYQYMNNS